MSLWTNLPLHHYSLSPSHEMQFFHSITAIYLLHLKLLCSHRTITNLCATVIQSSSCLRQKELNNRQNTCYQKIKKRKEKKQKKVCRELSDVLIEVLTLLGEKTQIHRCLWNVFAQVVLKVKINQQKNYFSFSLSLSEFKKMLRACSWKKRKLNFADCVFTSVLDITAHLYQPLVSFPCAYHPKNHIMVLTKKKREEPDGLFSQRLFWSVHHKSLCCLS